MRSHHIRIFPLNQLSKRKAAEQSCSMLCKTDFDTFMNRIRWHDAFNKMGLNANSGGVSPS